MSTKKKIPETLPDEQIEYSSCYKRHMIENNPEYRAAFLEKMRAQAKKQQTEKRGRISKRSGACRMDPLR